MRSRVDPPIGWIGGKSRLADLIVARFPEHKAYVEVFGGAGWVLFRKPAEKCEVYNDLDSELVNLFRVLKERYEDFLREFRLVLVSRQIWGDLKRLAPEQLSEVRRAARFFYLIKASFAGRGGSFGVRTDGPSSLNLKRLPEIIEAVHERLMRVQSSTWISASCSRSTTGRGRCFTWTRRTWVARITVTTWRRGISRN